MKALQAVLLAEDPRKMIGVSSDSRICERQVKCCVSASKSSLYVTRKSSTWTMAMSVRVQLLEGDALRQVNHVEEDANHVVAPSLRRGSKTIQVSTHLVEVSFKGAGQLLYPVMRGFHEQWEFMLSSSSVEA